MRKLLVIGQYPPPYHGSNVMAGITVKILKEIGYSVSFIDKKFSTQISQIGRLNFRKLIRIPVLWLEILVACIKEKPALCIYFPAVGKSAFLLDFIYLYLIRKCHVPYILRFGGKGYSLLQKESYFWFKIVKIALSNATGGIVLSNSLKNDVMMNIKENKLLHVPNCCPYPTFIRLKIQDNSARILFLSNLIPSKGVMEVLKAARIVLKDKEVYFTLAGTFNSKRFENIVRSFIKSNKIDKFVKLPGSVIGEEKAQLFNESDIFLFPTYYEKETFGIVNVEAMSYGLPIISSNEAAIPEIVQDGVTGFIVNPRSPEEIADKILFLLENPFKRKEMGEKGKSEFFYKYSYAAYSKNLDHAIGQFIQFSLKDKIK